MAHAINELCINCDVCRPECPTGSIFVGAKHYLIDFDTCSNCAICAKICPVEAILPVEP